MKTTNPLTSLRALTLGVAIALGSASAGCGGEPVAKGIEPKVMTDALFAVMSADRAVYTKEVVNRLANQEKVIKASEHFSDDKALPLPAQMFRMGAEASQKANGSFSYSLLSLWPWQGGSHTALAGAARSSPQGTEPTSPRGGFCS